MRISDWSSDVCSSDLIDRILRGVWDNLGRTVAEYPHLLKIWDYDPEHPTRAGRIEVAGVEEFVALRDDGKPALIFSAHLGNWELLPLAAARYGLPLSVVFRSEERRVGKECVSTCSYRWSPYHSNKKNNTSMNETI